MPTKKKKPAKGAKGTATLLRLSKELKEQADKNTRKFKKLSSYLIRTDQISSSESIPVYKILPRKQTSRQKIRSDVRPILLLAIKSLIEKTIVRLAKKNLKYKFKDAWLDGLIRGSLRDGEQSKLDLLIGVQMPFDKRSHTTRQHFDRHAREYHERGRGGSILVYEAGSVKRYSTDYWGKKKIGEGKKVTNPPTEKEAEAEDEKYHMSKCWLVDINPFDETSHINIALLISISVFKNDAKRILKGIAIKQGGALGVEHNHVNEESVAKLDKMMRGALTRAIIRNMEARRNKHGARDKKVMVTSNMILIKSIGFTDPPKPEFASITVEVK